MTITPGISATNAMDLIGTKTVAAAKPNVDYSSFLKLLVTQMKNQDPTQPMDATQYVAQLASFSNVEQAVQMNAKLDALIVNSASSQAGSLIGRTLTTDDGGVSGKVSSVTLQGTGMLAKLADGTVIQIGPGTKIS